MAQTNGKMPHVKILIMKACKRIKSQLNRMLENPELMSLGKKDDKITENNNSEANGCVGN